MRLHVFFVRLGPWSLPARKLFRLLAKADGGTHTFSASEYVFPNIIVTLWDADSQYDHLAGESRPVYCQVGVGSREYLRVVEGWRAAAHQAASGFLPPSE
jgi:hypothetical protein